MVEETLSAAQLEELAALLRQEREQVWSGLRALEREVQALGESQGEESGPGGEQADIASDLAQQSVDLALESAERIRLDQVEAALERIAQGAYGTCESCGQPIAVERLYARPWASRCRACAGGTTTRPR